MDDFSFINHEARLTFAESESEKGKMKAMVARYGPRQMLDGRRIFWTSEMFRSFTDNFKDANRPLPMYFNHKDMEVPMGHWNQFEDDEDEFGPGLMGYGELFLDTTDGADTYAVLKRSPNLMQGVSIGLGGTALRKVDELGAAVKDNDPMGYWQVDGAYLKEVSVTYQAADPQADIKELFYADGAMNLHVVEKRLRDVGLSKATAKQACAAFRGLALRDAVKDEKIVAHDERDVQACFAKVSLTTELLKVSSFLNKRLEQ